MRDGIEKLRHVIGRGVTHRQWREAKTSLDQFKYRRIIPRGVGDKMRFHPGRNDGYRYPEAGLIEVAGDVIRTQVLRGNPVGLWHRHRGHMIVLSATLVIAEDKD